MELIFEIMLVLSILAFVANEIRKLKKQRRRLQESLDFLYKIEKQLKNIQGK